ncbi:hypothetical protein NEMBOFW57_010257 [Staphylotrichum longicolle]|uniref:F-box domain-containing protein n=1 Tax=Staphylotrichum longicolle TaxID=669026 RepID=A0AAD4EQF9_9PEZI|nr:hypothetical protein NEMBOFW57_010257 [Staphylotrichum longicolle]
MAPSQVEPSAADSDTTPPPRPSAPEPGAAQPPPAEPAAQGGANFIHGLIGLSPGGFSETVRNSISSLARREPEAPTLSALIKPDDNNSPPAPPPAPPPGPRRLLALPPEILLMIVQRLDFADIVRLRKTCKQLHALASPQQLRILFGPAQLRMQLLGHCKSCLTYDPFRRRLLQPTLADPGYPLASCCLDCALKSGDPRIRVGKKINLANFDTVWVCRWCGYPIIEGGAFGCEQMHRFCYKRYNDALFIFFVLGWLQLSMGIVAAALAWKYYRNAVLVFAPTVTNFILLWICLGFLICRGNVWRTYHCTLVLELIIFGLWIPPIYHLATEIANASGDPIPKSTQATLALFVLNM